MDVKSFLFIFCTKIVISNCQSDNPTTVTVTANRKYQTFNVPLSKTPIACWMDIQLGQYPNLLPIVGEVALGERLSVVVVLRDRSGLYDLRVVDCFAYDSEDPDRSQHALLLYPPQNKSQTRKTVQISEWKRERLANSSSVLIHGGFSAFRFPEKDRLYVTCDVEICYKNCEKQTTNVKHNILK